jgi:hypothetical protein
MADSPASGTPRWVKVTAIVGVVLLALVVVLLITGRGGGHGPGRHTNDGDTPPTHTGPPPGMTHP